jgi:HK97 family phage major capsid protein
MTYNGVDETTRASGSVHGGVIGYWLNEGGTKTSSKPVFYQVELKLKKIAALMYATDELLEDVPALESWIGRQIPAALRWFVEKEIVSGNGVGKPTGFLNAPCVVNPLRVDANKVQVADIATMWSRRYTYYNDYVWLINPSVIVQLHQLAITYPVYLPPGGLSAAPYGSIYGRPVIESEFMPALGTTGDITLASLSQYQAISKGGVQAASSIHVAFVTDETAFRFVYRFDGGPLWNSALTPYAGSTLSPFVALSSATV